MAIICLDCGNTKEFSQEVDLIVQASEISILDGDTGNDMNAKIQERLEGSMINVEVFFENGNSFVTGFNGTIQDAEKYYVGVYFNLGNADRDIMTKGVKVVKV